jgi:hypothetical protein
MEERVEFLTKEFAFDHVEVLTKEQIDELRINVELVNSNLADYPDLTPEEAYKNLIFSLQKEKIPFCGNHNLLRAFEYGKKVSGNKKNLYFRLSEKTCLFLYYNYQSERFFINLLHDACE